MAAGLLDGLMIVQAIMAEQGCTWDAATRLWHISMEMEAERRAEPAEPSNVILFRPRPRARVRSL